MLDKIWKKRFILSDSVWLTKRKRSMNRKMFLIRSRFIRTLTNLYASNKPIQVLKNYREHRNQLFIWHARQHLCSRGRVRKSASILYLFLYITKSELCDMVFQRMTCSEKLIRILWDTQYLGKTVILLFFNISFEFLFNPSKFDKWVTLMICSLSFTEDNEKWSIIRWNSVDFRRTRIDDLALLYSNVEEGKSYCISVNLK